MHVELVGVHGLHVHVCVYIHVYIYIYIYIYMPHINSMTYIHAYIYTYIQISAKAKPPRDSEASKEEGATIRTNDSNFLKELIEISSEDGKGGEKGSASSSSSSSDSDSDTDTVQTNTMDDF